MAVEDLDVERRGVAPHVEARLVAHLLDPGEGHRVAARSAQPEPVEHLALVGVVVLHEQVEPAALDVEPAAEEVGVDVAGRRPLVARLGHEPVDVVDRDGQLEHQPVLVRPTLLVAGLGVVHPERHEALHLLGEQQPAGLGRGRYLDDVVDEVCG